MLILAAALAGVAVYLLLPAPSRNLAATTPAGAWREWGIRVRSSGPAAARRQRDREVSRVIDMVLALSAELRAGQPPAAAWSRLRRSSLIVAEGWAETEAATLDVPSVLRSAAAGSGRGGLARVAACWEVAEHSGAGLATALERVVQSLAAEREIAAEIDGQLAGARATARLLVVLPALALILGESLGAEPVRVLCTTPYGWGCLLAGSALSVVGSRWIEQQLRSASPWADR